MSGGRREPEPRALDSMAIATILLAWLAFFLLQQNMLAGVGGFVALGCALARGRVPLTRTHWMIFGLAALLGSITLFKATGARAQMSGLVYPPLYPVCITLGLCTYPALLRRHTRREYWASICISAIFLMISGLNLAPLIREFALVSALWTCAFCLSTRANLAGTRPSLAAWMSLVPGGALLIVIALAYTFSEYQVNMLLRLLTSGQDVSLAFPAQSRLNTMGGADGNPAVVCRVFSEKPNRYLPARVYADYQDATWHEAEGSAMVSGRSHGEDYRYVLNSQKGLVRERFEVRSSPIVLFAPRDAVAMELGEPQLAQLSGHLLELRGGGNDLTAYWVERRPDESLAPPEEPGYVQRCARAADVSPVVGETAARLVGTGNTMEKASRIESWLQENFAYGFGYDWANAKDPVADFLTKKPPAHCEVFATAMTLMLRSQGIPCRYINGFAVVERSWTRDYWVVRVRNAHAWCEVWDGQAWRTFDPTPPAALEHSSNWADRFDSFREALTYKLRSFFSGGWKDWLAAAWARRAWLGAVFLGLALWKARKMPWFPRLVSRSAPQAPQSEWMRQLQSRLARHGLGREPWETLQHWSRRLSDWPHGEGVSSWLEAYGAFRYGGGSPAEEAKLQERLQALLVELDGLKDPQSPPG